MKNLLLLVVLLVLSLGRAAWAQTPIDTTGGRYFKPIFSGVTVTQNVQYGSAVPFSLSGSTVSQPLLMDIYEPTGDVSVERPVIIFAHQGGFVTGSRTDSYMVAVCTQFAKLGYVTASIDYRLLFLPLDTTNFSKAALRGMQDMRAAVRFFRRDAATTNTYRASPGRIVVGGASAGGFMALEVGYLDKTSEVPADIDITLMDGIEGASGNPGYPSAVLAVLNLSGASNPTSIIETGNAPLYSAHGTSDAIVPYFKGRVNLSPLPPKYVFGSGALNPYASGVGVPNVLRRFSRAPHIPQYPVQSANAGSANYLAYADTTYRDIRAFLRPLLGPFVAPAYPSLVVNTPTSIAGGSYQDITINSGEALLLGDVTVYGTLVIKSLPGQTPGALKSNCFVVNGSGNFDLQAGATLRICDPDGISASGAAGAIRNTGARSFSTDAGYVYEGTTNQSTGTGLPATVRELEVAVPAANSVALTSAVGISQRFLPTSGVLVTNGQALTLLSGPSGTALATPGAGTLSGSFTMQRYLDPSGNPGPGYRHLSMPFDAETFRATTPATTQVFNAAYNGSARPDLVTPFPNVFAYDQQRATTSPATSYSEFDKGWFVPANPNNSLALPSRRGLGYTVNLSAGQTITAAGPLTNNNSPFALTLAAAATPTAGWHLLGNPFASALNWDNVPIPAGMSSAMYIFVSSSQYAGNYRSYVNGMGGVGSTIPLGQGFLVRSLASTAVTLTIPVAARITDFATANTATVQRPAADPRPRLRLTLADAAGAAPADEAYLYLEAGATAGPDLRYDAAKLPNPSGLNLASVAAGQQLAINGLPLLTAATVVPLALTAPTAGAYVLTAEQLTNFAPGTTLYLTDAATSRRTLLAAGTRYAFTLASTGASGRFALEITPAAVTATTAAQTLGAQLQVYPNPASEHLQVELPAAFASAIVPVTLTNALGQVARRQQLVAPAGQPLRASLDLRGLTPGVYQLHITVSGTALVRRVVVQ
ncbi:alpha/beta hydrolase fold domain-containing protein [Hymenobacter rubidus]|uniref:alpha/beta hydrolase fold domain-containing protein n=1 Tax=Hymenobacter rubidus TaxID=1441626 RepID=UPI00191E7D2A|nr:alpha/beta hydrolase fold domain-containing protein [Hymenobacter rubidus]